MTVETIYAIAIATPSDRLTNLAPVFSTSENQDQNQSYATFPLLRASYK